MITNLQELYQDQIRDLYSAETQLTVGLEDMLSHATSAHLRSAFTSHLEETHQHRIRLEEIGIRHGFDLHGVDCEAMRGLIKEAKKHASETVSGDVRDAVLIASGNRIEHYEIAGYGVAKSFASCLGYLDDADLLNQTLEEESEADDKITKIAVGGLFRTGVNDAAI
jgi:ferritin-like metal-binding protein YciE